MTEAQVDPQTVDVIERLREVTLANAEATSQAAPIIQALTVVVTALSGALMTALDIDREQLPETITAGVDESTAAVIRQIVPRIEAMH